MGILNVIIGLKNSAFKNGLDQMRSQAASWSSGMSGMFRSTFQGGVSAAGRLLQTLANMKIVSEGIAVLWRGIKGIFTTPLDKAGDLETLSVSLEVLIGDADKADKLLKQLKRTAAETPFQFGDIGSAATKLIAFGEASENVNDTLLRIGDISAGVRAPIGEIAEIYGKARVQGTLFAEDINQLTGRGIPVIQEFAKILGVSESEVKKLASQGQVTFPVLEQAFINLTSEGGKFAGLMQRMSETNQGLWSTIRDGWNAVLVKIGTPINDALRPVLKDAISLLAELQPLASRIGEVFRPAIEGMHQFVKEARDGGNLVGMLGERLRESFRSAGEILMLPVRALMAALPEIGNGLMAVMKPTGDWLYHRLEAASANFIAIMKVGVADVVDSMVNQMRQNFAGIAKFLPPGARIAFGLMAKNAPAQTGKLRDSAARDFSHANDETSAASDIIDQMPNNFGKAGAAFTKAFADAQTELKNGLTAFAPTTPEKDDDYDPMDFWKGAENVWVANDVTKMEAEKGAASAPVEVIEEKGSQRKISVAASSLAAIGGGGGAYVAGTDPHLREAQTQTSLLRQLVAASMARMNEAGASRVGQNPF